MKNITKLLLILLLCMPMITKAGPRPGVEEEREPMTEEEVIAKLNELPVTIENGVEYMDIPSIDPDLFIEDGRCVIDREFIIEGDPDYYNSLSGEELDNAINEAKESYKKECKNQNYYSVLLFYFKDKGMDFHMLGYGAEFIDKYTVKFMYSDNISSISKEKTVKLRYITEYDEKNREEAIKIERELKKDYNIYGLAMLNSLYHYGGIDENIYNNDLVLYRFDDLKETIEKYDSFEIVPRLHGAGGTPLLSGNAGNLGIFKDGIMYGMKETHFAMNHIIYVSEDEEGTLFEKAEKLVSDYFKNEVEISVDSDTYDVVDNDEWINAEINEYLGRETGEYSGILTTIKVADKESMLFIVEVPEEYLEDTTVKSNHNKTGININTNSYHVPTDVTLNIKDVLKEEYVKKFITNYKYVLNSAFDINLVKTGDGGFVNKIPDGVEVYIPVTGKKEKDKIKIHYIKEDATLGETIVGEVVLVDGKTYAKFVTKHFSTYAIEDILEEEVPNTIDNITVNYIIISISIVGFLLCLSQIKKSRNN